MVMQRLNWKRKTSIATSSTATWILPRRRGVTITTIIIKKRLKPAGFSLFLQNHFHPYLLREKPLCLIKTQGGCITAPNVQRQVIATVIAGKGDCRII